MTPDILQVVVNVGILLVLVVILVRINALGKPGPTAAEGTRITAKELAVELGGSIESAFRNYVPQPDKLAAVVTSTADTALKNTVNSLAGTLKTVTDGVDGLHKRLAESQAAGVEKLQVHTKETTAALEAARKAIETATSQLSAALTAGSEKLQAAVGGPAQQIEKATTSVGPQVEKAVAAGAQQLQQALTAPAQQIQQATAGVGPQIEKAVTSGVQQLQQALTGPAQQLQQATAGVGPQVEKAVSAGAEKLQAAMASQLASIEKASGALGAQADRVLAVGKDIQGLLQVTQAVEGAIKTLASADEFKRTLAALQTHLAQSDELIKVATKPRKISFVERELEG